MTTRSQRRVVEDLEELARLRRDTEFDWRPAVEYLKAHMDGETRAHVEALAKRLYAPREAAR